jgi:hypothetical protein
MVQISYAAHCQGYLPRHRPIMPMERAQQEMVLAQLTVAPARKNADSGTIEAVTSPVTSQLRNPDQRLCSRCGATMSRRRRTLRADEAICSACDQRDRRAAYFRAYYEEHKDRILDKNRRWAKDNKTRIVQLRQARRVKDSGETLSERLCIDCETPVTRAARCRKCYIRFRYATDPQYRARRLATTRRWLDKRQSDPRPARTDVLVRASAQARAN